MSAAEPQSGRRFWLAAGAIALLALVLRLWGHRHGLPFVYNADENAHFVARAIGMFGHSYDPNYFINPPAFSYLLHVLFFLRWGGEGVQSAYAADPGDVFALARAASAFLGAGAVALLALAGRRLFGARVGLLAAGLLAVAFLPVHYGHYALNDVPALAPACLALVGIAGVHRRGAPVDYVVAGIGLGLAGATKYTAGILLFCLLAAARDRRLVAVSLAAALAAFLAANPYALLSFDAFKDGLIDQSSASNDGGGKLGLVHENGWLYYLGTTVWGLGWVPAFAALAGGVLLIRRDRRLAWVLLPAVVVFIAFMGSQDRFFARWLLPIYPLLCLLAAYAAIAAVDRLRHRPRALLALAAVLLCGQGLVYSVHNDVVLARPDTRAQLREWMVANVPQGAKIVLEPIAPDQWATDPGRPSAVSGNGARWIKWRTSRARFVGEKGPARRVKLEDYERTLEPRFLDSYAKGGFCFVITGSTQSGRAFAEPEQVPSAIAYYEELERRGEKAFEVAPADEDVPFSFDFSFNAYPLAFHHQGPAITVYRLPGCDTEP
jgi:hypothetical protein